MKNFLAIAVSFCAAPLCAADVDDQVIVAFGDSTTAPRGKLKIYADILRNELSERDLPARVMNAGIGGHNTNHARKRFEKDVLAQRPDIVVIQFGINDAAIDVWKKPPATKPRVSREVYEQNLRHFVGVLKKQDARVVLMTPNPLRWTTKMREMYGKPPYRPSETNGFNVMLADYAKSVREVAKATDVELVDVYESFEKFGATGDQSVDDLLLDGIHPNEDGHRLVADLLLPVLLKHTHQR